MNDYYLRSHLWTEGGNWKRRQARRYRAHPETVSMSLRSQKDYLKLGRINQRMFHQSARISVKPRRRQAGTFRKR